MASADASLGQPKRLPKLIGLYSDDTGNGVRETLQRLQNYHGYAFYDFSEPVKLMVMPLLAGFGENPRSIHAYAADPTKEIKSVGATFFSLEQRMNSAFSDLLAKMAEGLIPKMLKTGSRIVLLPINNSERLKVLRDNGGKLVKVTNTRLVKFVGETDHRPDFEISYSDDTVEITRQLPAMFEAIGE